MKTITPLALALVVMLSVASCTSQSEGNPPNIIILIADDLSWDDVGAYGNPVIRTPNIDALAQAGMRFDNAFLAASSCSASRGSILTGKYPHSNGLLHLHQTLPETEVTIAGLLGQHGYFTASVGKWHLGPSARDEFHLAIDDRSASGAEQWIQVLRDRPREQPFFLWFASRDPHKPYETDADDLPHAYPPDDLLLPATFFDGPESRRELALYYREVTRFDDYVGAVVDELRQQSQLQNTLIIVMSDNGRPFHLAKMLLYDDGVKTPFVMTWPKRIAAASVNDRMVSMVDLAPTLLEIARIPQHAEMQGKSFAPMFQDPNHNVRDVVYLERNWHGRNAHERAVRSRYFLYKENQFPLHGDCHASQYSTSPAFIELQEAFVAGKLNNRFDACFSETRPAVQLFDVSKPGFPHENLAQDPDYAGVVAEYGSRLANWRATTGDTDYVHYERPL